MKILLDCDGPLSDFTGAYVDAVNAALGSEYTPGQVDQWGISESLAPGDFARQMMIKDAGIEAVHRAGFVSSMDLQPWAIDLVDRCHMFGYVTIVTSPWHTSRHWHSERVRWLYDHFEIKGRDVIFCAKKDMIRGDVLIDDNADHVRSWAVQNPEGLAILWALPSNQHDRAELVRHAWNIVVVDSIEGLSVWLRRQANRMEHTS